ncbi:hypothetical protein QBC37DRAFT_294509 [Rhypophila decipiens]|uniref:Uncharacterized protein n=1 Tax=Rhypophila decipiens TaxID=261697 RepID=A0AAN7B3G1_9PEZI|nr:hypothetical protein QBC37DRAFT_294509 [Rhypophila decipiens]
MVPGRAPRRTDNIDIASLSANVSRPRMADILHVLHLHALANSVETACLNGSVYFEKYDICMGEGRPDISRGLPSLGEWNQTLKESFHRAVYRVLLAGPVVAGWYLEPFSTNSTPNILPPDVPPNLRMFDGGGIQVPGQHNTQTQLS